MAACSGRRGRRGPAPIASFDHDVSEESSPESKQAIRLPEIREDPAISTASATMIDSSSNGLAPPEQRARSHSSPAVHTHSTSPAPTVGTLQTPSAPRIDISRASSSSHHDSRDSSPELALFAGTDDSKTRLELGFREDGALDLRSSTEELAFLEGAPGGSDPPRAPSVPPSSRRHSRKDSQGSEAALLGVSGRTSRLSSIGSQCSAQSALSGFSHTSRVSRLSVVSSMSRSPSPHKMLLETSFCGPKPIETDPDICAAAVEQRLLEIAKMSTETVTTTTITQTSFSLAAPVDARDRREVRTEATVENARPASAPRFTSTSPQPVTATAPPRTPVTTVTTTSITSPAIAPFDDDKLLKETRNRAKVEERRTRPKVRRQPSEPEVFKSSNRSKNVIRIKLKPDEEYDEDDDESERTLIGEEALRKPVTLELKEKPARPTETISPHSTPRRPRDSRTPSPTGAPVSRKSSFCSLFKSRETIASPDSPSDVLKRKKSLNEGRSRSKSRDRSTTPTSATKIKGSMLSLFKTPRRSTASPSPSSRDASPVVQQHRQFPQTPADRTRSEKLKYYEESKDGIIHIPLRTPPDEPDRKDDMDRPEPRETVRPASAPQPRGTYERQAGVTVPKLATRTVLPDGSIIIPLHSPTEKTPASCDLTDSEPKTDHPSKSRDSDSKPIKVEDHILDTNSTRIAERQLPAESESTISLGDRPKKKERLIFTTHVGSREQVFSTQFSITKTPSVTSEISESAPSFPESEDVRPSEPTPSDGESLGWELPGVPDRRENSRVEREEDRHGDAEGERGSRVQSPVECGGDSSGSEASGRSCGSEAERRGLVVQESFEELPYVPTTLPLERSLALPMVPVRERGADVPVRSVQRPRARTAPLRPLASASPASPATPPDPVPSSPGAPPPAPPTRLRIRLPQRTRAASTSSPVPQRTARPRSRSGGDAGVEVRKGSWIDFAEVPEQRKQPKRIETVGGGPPVLLSYVPPERCRCECHHALGEPAHTDALSSSSLECEEGGSHGAPFTADLDLRNNHSDIARTQ